MKEIYSPNVEHEKKYPVTWCTTQEDQRDFVDFWHRKNDCIQNGDTEAWEKKRSIFMREFKNDTTLRIYVARDGKKVIGASRMNIFIDRKGYTSAYFSGLEILPEYQRKGVGTTLTQARIERARLEKAEKIVTHVRLNNIPAIKTKFISDFILTNIKPLSDEPLVADMELYLQKTKPDNPHTKNTEISMKDISDILDYLDAGWYGVDIKNIEDVANEDLSNWILILEKET